MNRKLIKANLATRDDMSIGVLSSSYITGNNWIQLTHDDEIYRIISFDDRTIISAPSVICTQNFFDVLSHSYRQSLR